MKRFISLAFALAASAAGATAQQGPIVIGQSAALSGAQSQYATDVRTGLLAYFTVVNKQGGINGRTLDLVSLDDGGEKDAVVENTKKLVEQHKATALIGYTSGAGVEATLEYIESAKVPMIAPMTGNMGIRSAFYRSIFHTRAGYADEMRKLVDPLATTGVQRFAVAYLDDVGPANPQSMHDALARHGLKPVAAVPLNRNATDFSAQVEQLLQAKPQMILFIANSKPIVKIVRAMRAKGYHGQFASSSFAGIGLLDELQEASHGLILSQVLPPPQRTNLKLVADYQAHLKDFSPTAVPNYTSLEGYIAARVLVEGLRRNNGSSSSTKLIAALEQIERLDLGGYEVGFSSKHHNGSRFVDTAIVSRERVLRF